MDETLLDGYKTAMLAPALCFYPGSSVDKGMNFGGKKLFEMDEFTRNALPGWS